MAYTIDDLEAIKKAIATGQKRVRLNGRELEYQSISQMLAAKQAIEIELNANAAIDDPTKRRPRGYRTKMSKGW